MKSKFWKNLYQNLSNIAVISLFDLILIYCAIRSFNQNQLMAFMFIGCSVLFLVLYLLIGFYWVFQMIEVDERGIKVKLFSKTIRDISWDNIESITYGGVLRNPAYIIKVKNQKGLNIDSRKKIKQAFSFYGKREI